MDTDFDLTTTTQELGFSLDVGPIIGDLRRLSPEESERALADQIRQKALVNVDVLSEILMTKAMDPTAGSKLVTDALDANYKMSGLAVKNAIKEVASAVTININIPRTDGTAAKTITVDGAADIVVPSVDDVRGLPNIEPAD
jgi:hypothetical protein